MLAPLLALVIAVQASDSVVAGRVTDSVTRAPLAGAVVTVTGSRAGTITRITGADGGFVLPAAGRVRLHVTRAGYAPADRAATAGDTVAIALVPAARSLEAVTVSALRGPADAPIAQTVIDRRAIERRYSGEEMPLLLQSAPAVTAYAESGASSNYTYLRLRGIDQTRINVTLDGVPLSEPEDQGIYFSNYPDFGTSIESVQIQRGVGTSSYGTASYAGAINFESLSLAGASRGGELQLGRGSFGSARASAEYQTGIVGERLALYGRVSDQRTDGYRYNSGSRAQGAFVSGGWFGERDLVKVTAFTGRTRNEMAYLASSREEIAVDPRANPLAESDDYHTTLASISYTRALGSAAQLATTAYHVDFGGSYDVRIAPDLYNFGLASRLSGAFSTWSWHSADWRVDAGVHANTYERDHFAAIRPALGARLYSNTGHKDDVSAFAKASRALGQLTLFGDVLARRPSFRYVPSAGAGVPGAGIAWTFVNPKMGATYRVSTPLLLHVSLGSTGREPTRSDMFAGFDDLDTSNVAFVGSFDRVRPEHVRDLELGASWRAPRLTLALTAYSMAFRNEITPIGALSYLGLPLRKNVGSSSRRGVELDAAWRATRALTVTGNVAVSRGRIRAYTDDASGQTFRDVEPLLSPRLIANHALEYRRGMLGVSLGGRYVGRAYLNNTGNRDFVTPPSHVVDAGADLAVGRVSFMATMRNVTGATVYTSGYTDGVTSYYYLAAPRNLFATVTTRF